MAGDMTQWAEDLSSSREALGSILHNEPAGHRDTYNAGTQEVEARGPQVQGHALGFMVSLSLHETLSQAKKQNETTTKDNQVQITGIYASQKRCKELKVHTRIFNITNQENVNQSLP